MSGKGDYEYISEAVYSNAETVDSGLSCKFSCYVLSVQHEHI